MVVIVMLGEHTEADLVEGRCRQCLQGVFEDLFPLQVPHIAGGAHRAVRRAVCIGEVEGILYLYRAVYPLPGRQNGKTAADRFLQKAAGDAEGILAFKGGHEAHHILPFAVVEAGGGALFPGAGKDGGKGLFAEGVALCRAGEDDLLHAPAGQSGKMGTRHRSASFPVRL